MVPRCARFVGESRTRRLSTNGWLSGATVRRGQSAKLWPRSEEAGPSPVGRPAWRGVDRDVRRGADIVIGMPASGKTTMTEADAADDRTGCHVERSVPCPAGGRRPWRRGRHRKLDAGLADVASRPRPGPAWKPGRWSSWTRPESPRTSIFYAWSPRTEAQAKLVMVGDGRQLGPVGPSSVRGPGGTPPCHAPQH